MKRKVFMKLDGFYIFNPLEEKGIEEKVRLVIYDNRSNEYIHFKIIDEKKIYELSHKELNNHFDYKYKYQIQNDTNSKKWSDLGDGYRHLLPEIIDESGLKYIFYPAQEPCSKLVICFQAIQTRPGYNYIRTLSEVNAHRLYIKDGYGLDDKTHSSYYLNEGNPIPVSTLVQKLIKEYVDYLNISREDTIFIGSSKGGYASLYHGYKFNAGYVVVGGPQVLLGNYLFGRSEDAIGPPIFKALFGIINEENRIYANNLLYNVLANAKSPYPNTFIHVGKGEPHYLEHAVPFMNWVKELNIKNVSWDLADYNTHEELATYYPPFLKKIINEIINK